MERRFVVFSRINGGTPNTIQSGVVHSAERAGLAWAGTASLPYHAQDSGLPLGGELARIGKIEDQLIESLERSGSLFVGHITGAGRTRVMFYSPSQGPGNLLVKVGLLKKEEIAFEWRQDPEWTLYDLELQPTPEEAMLDRFRNLWDKLLQHGDNPGLERQVDFTFVFPSAEESDAFLADAANAGFTPVGDPGLGEGGYWCEVHKDTAIVPAAMVPYCVALEEMAVRRGGVFDGWACHVTK